MIPGVSNQRDLSDVRGEYGFDAPYVPILLGAGGVVLIALTIVNVIAGSWIWAGISLVLGAYMLLAAGCYLYTTRRGKFVVWASVLERMGLRGRELLLDMGCGRGAVLLMAAKLLPDGRAEGVDLWKTSDQSGNALDVTHANAEREGVADRVDLHTGDMTQMPFENASFDVVVSSLAIHNITSAEGRAAAVAEAARVLRPGGRLAIADIRATREYERTLRAEGMEQVTRHPLGWRFWYGGPWVSTSLVTAVKPVA